MVQLCYKYANDYEKANSKSEVLKIKSELSSKYNYYQARHVLCHFLLNDEEYLSEANNIKSLIQSLYNDERIVNSANTLTLPSE